MAYVGVVGPSSADERELDDAESLGRGLAQRGHVVVCGGLGGIMEAVARGAAQAGGIVVGLLPGTERTDANAHVTVAIPTGSRRDAQRPARAVQRRRRERRRVVGNAQRDRPGGPHGRAGDRRSEAGC